jgi:hypothetical protein
MRLWQLKLVVALAFVVSGSAGAVVKRVAFVVVPTDAKDTSAALELERAAVASLAEDVRLDLIDPSARYAPASLKLTAAQLEEARSAEQEVSALADRLELPAARARAEVSLEALRFADFRSLREVYLLLLVDLARVKHTLRVDDGGASELVRALVIEPELAVPRGLNSAERAWFLGARHAMAVARRASPVTIDSSGGPGWVWLDGRFRGLAPVTISNVPAGRHFITFAAVGAEPQHRSELLGTLARVTFTSPLSPEGHAWLGLMASLASALRRGVPGAAVELLAWTGAEVAIVVSLTAQRPSKVSCFSAVESSELELDASATPLMVAQRALEALEALDLRPGLPVPAPKVSGAIALASQGGLAVEAQPPRSRAPGIVLLSVAAAAVAAGTVLAIAGRMSSDRVQGSDVGQVTYHQGIQAANQLASSSLCVFGGAAIAAGVGVALVW